MDNETSLREEILQKIEVKSNLEQKIFDNTFNVLLQLKEILHEMSSEIDNDLKGRDKRIKIEYRDRGKFEAQLQIAGDTLIFSMHTNVFRFNREHLIWQNSYVANEQLNGYCGIINIYNFLSDSFKYNRNGDEGYLIGRIFVNRDNHYCVEGKRQLHYKHSDFGSRTIDREALINIVEMALCYTIEFDLLVPQYDSIKIVSVDQLNTKIENSKMQTGKRLGYKFNSDDI
ncbi:MAG: hypothetical protein LIO79_04670 [Rikenellaceae bacterium]|nr:hypothetical protein [Rikenellaceae bacterium]